MGEGVRPVYLRAERLAEGFGVGYQGVGALVGAGLDDGDGCAGVGGEAVCEGEAGGSGADDDVVVGG